MGPKREDSAKFMGRIGGLLVLWFMVAMVGFTSKSLFWLAIVGLLMFVATSVFGAIKAEPPSLQGGRVGPLGVVK